MFKDISNDVKSLYRGSKSFIKSFLVGFIILLFFSNCCFGAISFFNASFETEYSYLNKNAVNVKCKDRLSLEVLKEKYIVDEAYEYTCVTDLDGYNEYISTAFTTKDEVLRSKPGNFFNDRFDGAVLSDEKLKCLFPFTKLEDVIGQTIKLSVFDQINIGEISEKLLHTYEVEIVNYFTAKTGPSFQFIRDCFLPKEQEVVIEKELYCRYIIYKDAPIHKEDFAFISTAIQGETGTSEIISFFSMVQGSKVLYEPYTNLIQSVGISFLFLFFAVFLFYFWAALRIQSRELHLRKILGISKGRYYVTKLAYFSYVRICSTNNTYCFNFNRLYDWNIIL